MTNIHTTIAGRRHHQTPLGVLPSVTAILSATKDYYSKRAIASWKDRVGRNEADRIRDAAAERGTLLHKAIESYLKYPNKRIYFTDSTKELFELVKPLLDEVDPLHIESHTYHPKGYGGTPDLIANYQGELTLFDWKTSTKPKKSSYVTDYKIQIAAYIQAANWLFNLDIEQGIVVVVTPGAEEAQTFPITPRGLRSYTKQFNDRLIQFQDKYSTVF